MSGRSRLQLGALVGCVVVNIESLRDDSVGIDALMAFVIVVLDVVHVHGRFDVASSGGSLVHISSEGEQIGVLNQALLVGLEVDNIHRVEANQSREETDVSLRDLISREETLLGQDGLCLVQMLEQMIIGRVIRLLRLSKATAIHAIVDIGVNPTVELITSHHSTFRG